MSGEFEGEPGDQDSAASEGSFRRAIETKLENKSLRSRIRIRLERNTRPNIYMVYNVHGDKGISACCLYNFGDIR